MGWLEPIVNLLQYVWPLRRVDEWERGGRYWLGRWVRELAPGVYAVLPWFGEVMTVTGAEQVIETPRMDFTLKDGQRVTLVATVALRVVDAYRALNAADDLKTTMTEKFTAAIAAQLEDEDVTAFEGRRRKGFRQRLETAAQEALASYGIELTSPVSFWTVMTNPRTLRLVQ